MPRQRSSRRVATALEPGGKFLFTAPQQECEWPDNLTRQTSRSLGSDAYRRLVKSAGFIAEDETDDEGQNHYFFVRKPDNGDGAVKEGNGADEPRLRGLAAGRTVVAGRGSPLISLRYGAKGECQMTRPTRPGTVIFTGDKERLARFYEALTGLQVRASDEGVTVLASDEFELVIHALPGEPQGKASHPRNDAYMKPFFPVKSLHEARIRATALEGQLSPATEEWEARGFRACEAIDPDGNHIQFREIAP